jgi:hypothetical protein
MTERGRVDVDQVSAEALQEVLAEHLPPGELVVARGVFALRVRRAGPRTPSRRPCRRIGIGRYAPPTLILRASTAASMWGNIDGP